MLAGITLIANGIELNYPFEICINNLCKCCDLVIVNTDIRNRDNTLARLKAIQFTSTTPIYILETKWDWSVSQGKDLAYRANQCIDKVLRIGYVQSILYLQADEVIHPDQINNIKYLSETHNIALERTYFWKDLEHINKDWTLHIPRLCKLSNKLRVVEDGMSMCVDHDKGSYIELDPKHARIYHYSRIGNTQHIASRLNNLDSLFHKQEEFKQLIDYEFGINNNYEQGADTKNIKKIKLEHPPGIKEFYFG